MISSARDTGQLIHRMFRVTYIYFPLIASYFMSVAAIALCCNLTYVNGNIYSLLQLMKLYSLGIRGRIHQFDCLPETPRGIPSEFSLLRSFWQGNRQ